MITKIFPVAMILLSISAAIIYLFDHDLRHVIYWMSAAILTASVTF